MIGISTKGDGSSTLKALERARKANLFSDLNRYGQLGVAALSRATPVDTRLTADSWAYRIKQERNGPRIEWYNTNVVNGTSIAVLIQYGHGTGTGGFISGRDFINPSIQPLFDQFVEDIWKKVKA